MVRFPIAAAIAAIKASELEAPGPMGARKFNDCQGPTIPTTYARKKQIALEES